MWRVCLQTFRCVTPLRIIPGPVTPITRTSEENPLITEHRIFQELGETPQSQSQAFQEFCTTPLDAGALKKHIAEMLNLEMVLGGDMFKYRIQHLVDRPVLPRKTGRPQGIALTK